MIGIDDATLPEEADPIDFVSIWLAKLKEPLGDTPVTYATLRMLVDSEHLACHAPDAVTVRYRKIPK